LENEQREDAIAVIVEEHEPQENREEDLRDFPSEQDREHVEEAVTPLMEEVVLASGVMIGHDESLSIEDSTFDENQLAEALRLSLQKSIPAGCGDDAASDQTVAETCTQRALYQAVAGLTYASASRRASVQSTSSLESACRYEAAADDQGWHSARMRGRDEEIEQTNAPRIKLKKVLLRFDPPGIGLQHTDGQGGIAVRHKSLPSKNVVASDEDIQILVVSLLKSERDLLSPKKHRDVLLSQLRHLYSKLSQNPSGAVPSGSDSRRESHGVATPPTARPGSRRPVGVSDEEVVKDQGGSHVRRRTETQSYNESRPAGSESMAKEVQDLVGSVHPAAPPRHQSCSEEAAQPFSFRPSIGPQMVPAYATV
jgi:hypothetical protein